MARHSRRLIYWTIGSLAGLAVLAMLTVVLLLFVIDPDLFRGRIEAAASQAAGRSVRFSGDLRWHVGRRIALESRGGEVANAAGFGTEPLARWSVLRLGVALRPLFRREIHVDHVELEGLQLDLQRDAGGKVNWQLGAGQAAQPAGSELEFQVGDVALREGRVRYRDAMAGRDWTMDELELEVGLPEDLRAAALEFRGITLRAHARGAPLAPPGAALAVSVPMLRVEAAAGALSAPRWQLDWNDSSVEGSIELRTGDALQAQGNFSLRTPSLRRLLASASFPLPATRDAGAYGAMELRTPFAFAAGGLDLPDIQARLDDVALHGSASAPTLSPLSLRFELDAGRMDVDRYLPPEDAASEPFELPLAALRALDARGVLRIAEARMAGAVARELRIDVE